MNVQPLIKENRVRISAWVPREVADAMDRAALSKDSSSSGYVAGVLTAHAAALDLFAQGVDATQIAVMLGKDYYAVMLEIGAGVDAAVKRALGVGG